MAEPQPATVQEGADVEDETPSIPKSAEDRKAAAALSSVAARDDDAAQPAKEVDQEALGKAIKNLDIGAGTAGAAKKEPAEKKKVVKVDQADVALVMDELDLSKIKATDLLRAHEGDAVKAMEVFVTASA
ncbi:MAG: hypothetical protein M1832_004183 [Thelocarpon impressellum]|nr:MAG: hypothetical protein M1832_004183 [Thelocarpon impressellum]